MNRSWDAISLGRLVKFANGRSSPPRTGDGSYPVYGSNGVIGFAEESNADASTIVVGRVGSYCGSLFFTDRPCWVTDNAIKANARDDNDPRFLFYLLTTLQLNSRRAGSGQPLLNQEILSGISVSAPQPSEQRAIATVLGALDDKIEANRRMNATLEAIARALFKSWFIDFDPVLAKMEGREPAIAPDLAGLFPARLAESRLGPIPEGWEVGDLSALAELNPESWGRSDYPDEVEYLDLANTKWGEISEVQLFERSDAPSRAQRVLRSGDTVVATVRPGNGGFALIDRDGLTGSTGFAALRPVLTAREFVYLRATAREAIDLLAHLADGGAYPAVRPQAVIDLETVVPPPAILREFSALSGPWLDRIAMARAESRTIAQLRDLLLPKLLSGALRVHDAERLVENAGG